MGIGSFWSLKKYLKMFSMFDGIIISGFYFYSAYSYLMGLKALLAYSTSLHLPIEIPLDPWNDRCCKQ